MKISLAYIRGVAGEEGVEVEEAILEKYGVVEVSVEGEGDIESLISRIRGRKEWDEEEGEEGWVVTDEKGTELKGDTLEKEGSLADL